MPVSEKKSPLARPSAFPLLDPIRSGSAWLHTAGVDPGPHGDSTSAGPAAAQRWCKSQEQVPSTTDAISAGLTMKENQAQVFPEGNQGGPSPGDRRPSGGRAEKQLCSKTGLAAPGRGAGTKQHPRGSTYTSISSPNPT